MLKKVFSILLIALIILQSTGLILYQAIESYLVHCEMMQKIKMKRTDWTYLTLTEEEFEKASIGESELNLSGKYYDIASVEVNGNNLYIKALHDEDEENIFSELNNFFGKNSEKSKSALRHLLKFNLPYICSSKIAVYCYSHQCSNYSYRSSTSVLTAFLDPAYNPPELS